MKGEPIILRQHHGVARREPKRASWAATRRAVAEDAGVSQRKRDHGCGKVLLVAILMQPHLGRWPVIVDEAGFGWMRIAGEIRPGGEDELRQPGPRPAGDRMGF